MSRRIEIRLSGSGGQGLLTAGIVLAYAMGIGEGYNVVQTQSYGPEARGGSSRSDIVVSDEEIYNPKPTELDILLCMNQESCDAFIRKLKANGLLIVDSDLVKECNFDRTVGVPFTKLAKERFSTPVVANIIALGFICGYTGLASEKSLSLAIENKFAARYVELNKKASMFGFALGKAEREKHHFDIRWT